MRGQRGGRRVLSFMPWVRLRAGLSVGLWVGAVGWGVCGGRAATAQAWEVTAFTDDSPVAKGTLRLLPELVSRGNLVEAARGLQRVLEEHGDRVVEVEGESARWVSVRERVHGVLLGSPELLAVYREQEGATAARMLEEGAIGRVAAERGLTDAGLEAVLRLAQLELEAGRFHGARRMLEGIESHPGRTGELAAGAADLMALVAGYVDEERVWARAEGWARAAGRPAPKRAAAVLASGAFEVGLSPLSGLTGGMTGGVGADGSGGGVEGEGLGEGGVGAASLRRVVPSQLASAALPAMGPGDAPVGGPRVGPVETGNPGGRVREAWAVPTIAGELVIVNDGVAVGAWDRFTLSPRWRFETGQQAEGLRSIDLLNQRRTLDGDTDPATVTVVGGTVYVAMGLPGNAERLGDGRIYALDAATGERLWSVDPGSKEWAGLVRREIEPEPIAAGDVGEGGVAGAGVGVVEAGAGGATESAGPLAGYSVRGPLLVGDGVVVATVRRGARAQRIASVALIAMDSRTGEPLWVRPLGSVGSLPFQRAAVRSHGSSLERGVVYGVDEIGLIWAVEAATGRVVWITQMPGTVLDTRRSGGRGVWSLSAALPLGDGRLVVLSPGREALVLLDAADGSVIGSMDAERVDQPDYAVRVGRWVACVGVDAAVFVEIPGLGAGDGGDGDGDGDGDVAGAGWGAAQPRVARWTGHRPVGVAWPIGGRLGVPTDRGLLLIEPETGDWAEPIAFDRLGHTVAQEGLVVTVTGDGVLSYLDWEAASRILGERLAADPSDTTSAITLLELAYRADRPERLLEAGAAAAAAVGLGGSGAGAARLRLYESLEAMVGRSLDGAAPLEAGVSEGLLRTMGGVASGADETLVHRLLLGRWHEHGGRGAEALEAYQGVLTDEMLAQANWRGPGRVVRGELEAGQRVAELVGSGRAGYGRYDAAAARELEASRGHAEAAGVSRRYPMALIGPEACLRAAERIGGAGEGVGDDVDPELGRRLLRAGLMAHARLRRAGREAPVETAGALVGRLTESLLEAGRLDEAADALAGAASLGVIEARIGGETEPIGALSLRVNQRLEARRRAPRVGGRVVAQVAPMLLAGYVLEPLFDTAGAERGLGREAAFPDGVLLMHPQGRTLTWVRPRAEGADAAGGEAGAGPVVAGWSRPAEAEAVLLTRDDNSAWLLWLTTGGRVIERVSLADGGRLWISRELLEVLGGPRELSDEARGVPRGRARVLASVISEPVLMAMERGVIVVADRAGRVTAIDAAGGETLWSGRLGLTMLNDLDLRGGVVVGAGAGPGVGGRAASGLIDARDARTGAVVQRIGPMGAAAVRWARITASGEVLAAMEDGLVHLRALSDGAVVWAADLGREGRENDAVSVGPRVLMVSDNETAEWLDLGSGDRGAAFELRASLGPEGFVRALRAPGRGLIVSGMRGLTALDASGSVVWRDGLTPGAILTPAVMAGDRAVTVGLRRGPAAEIGGATASGESAELLVFDVATGRLVQAEPLRLGAPPESVAVVDGAILISAGEVTMALAMPPEPESSGGGAR